MTNRAVIVDSGVANITSVRAALARLGVDVVVSANSDIISNADRVVLPGVGSAAAAMEQLKSKGLVDVIRKLTQPVLGICLGMQLLFESSEESGGADCLNLIEGKVRMIEAGVGMPVPHMGWNRLSKIANHPLLDGVQEGDYVYFVHSYAAEIGGYTLAACEYGAEFSAVVGQDNFFGCQFHPERSGKTGARILKNFMEM